MHFTQSSLNSRRDISHNLDQSLIDRKDINRSSLTIFIADEAEDGIIREAGGETGMAEGVAAV